MDEKRTKLKEFILKYGCDFLDDGTKDRIVKKIDSNDDKLILEILQVIDKDWIKRVEEMGKFYVFTDNEHQDSEGKRIVKPFMKANYIDSHNPNETHIPVLRMVEPRYKSWYEVAKDIEL